VRRKRPPALSFLLRMDTLRRIARAVSLLALDFFALFLAIATALGLKAAARDTLDTSVVLHQAKDYVWFAFLVTALLFAKAGLYGDRAVRPGLSSIVASLFQVTVVIALYAIVSGQDFSSYYIFYGTLFFAVAYVSTLRFAYERTTGLLLRAAGYQRRAVLVGTGEHIEDVAHALLLGRRGQHQRHRLRVAGAAAAQRADLAGHPGRPGRHRARPSRRRGHHRRPGVPRARGGRARRPVPPARRRGPHRALDDGDPRPPRRVRPGQSVPLFELKPPVFEGFDYALKRSFDLVGSLLITTLLSPLPAGLRRGHQDHLARAGHLPLDAARDRRGALRVLQVPHDVPRRRRPPVGAGGAQRGLRAPCSRSATTRA
jgi:hypothetical protein